MNCFLIDYENVNTNGFRGITSLSRKDRVIVFYSENAETMTFGLHRRLNESKAEISFQKVFVGGKNALDFQLCTYLGYLIGRNARPRVVYYIVSSDQGYASIVDYWARQKVSVSVIPEIAAVSAPAKSPAPTDEPPPKPDVSMKEIQTLLKIRLPEKYHVHIPVIAEIIRRCPTRQAVNGELVRVFHQGGDNGIPSEIYRCVRPILTDKP
ncbi:MAG: hypothetical protein IJT31_05710 [Oscillibacter sp.]|nr:hypothetical protein [Oscillibacter sp.]